MWSIIIPIVTFILGLVLGAIVSTHLLKKQFTKMQSDPKQIQAIAKSMGVNMNQKQLNNITRQMNKPTKSNKKNK